MIQKIKDFFTCVKITWLCRLYLAAGILLITATYVGIVMDTSIEYTWYSIGISYIFGTSTLYITIFVLVLTGKGIYNLFKALINGDK